MDRLCVIDTSCLSIFARVGRIDLLAALVTGRCFAAAEVRAELENGVRAGHRALADVIEADWVDWTRLVSLEELATYADVLRFVGQAGHGEAATVALALSRCWLPVLDDLAARKRAAVLGLEVSGTAGLLADAAAGGLVADDQAWNLLQEMTTLGFRCAVTREEFRSAVVLRTGGATEP